MNVNSAIKTYIHLQYKHPKFIVPEYCLSNDSDVNEINKELERKIKEEKEYNKLEDKKLEDKKINWNSYLERTIDNKVEDVYNYPLLGLNIDVRV